MPRIVDLTLPPYSLDEAQIAWVEETVSSLSTREKLQQLFIVLTSSRKEEDLARDMVSLAPGGVRYNPAPAKDLHAHNAAVQKHSRIPCFIAANCEEGGNGAFRGGTFLGSETKIAATRDPSLAYRLGYVGAKEASAIGVNTIFAPIVDIHRDFHNPVIATRTFGNDPKLVEEMSLACLKGIHDAGLLSAAKHFPGDGYDERDQHLAPTFNPLSKEEWTSSFGRVYSSLIEEGLDMVMVGHIALPSYIEEGGAEAYLPASVSPRLVNGLLKEELGFNGLALTDATHMVGFSSAKARRDLLAEAISAGIDMILFYNDPEEDLAYLEEAYAQGRFDEGRLRDALRRILGLKAKLGYHAFSFDEDFPPFDEEGLSAMQKEHAPWAKEIADKGITLVKDLDGIFPISPQTHPRILLVPQEDENPFSAMMPGPKKTCCDGLKELLSARGFQVDVFESLMDKAKKLPPMEAFALVGNVYNNKTPVADLTSRYDLVIQVARFDPHNTTQRMVWKLSKGTADVPWYVHELPVVFVSLCCPFHLFDVPQVRTYLNCYDANKATIESLVEKMVGESPFVGESPVDAFCGCPNTRF